MPAFDSAAGMTALKRLVLGPSDWLTVTQEKISAFAEATGDRQWIHVDPDRARTSTFGTTIAHGFLTLSCIPVFGEQLISFAGPVVGINYGVNRVRFAAPVPSGARIRGTVALTEIAPIPGGVQVLEDWTIELEGSERPACVAQCVVRFLDD